MTENELLAELVAELKFEAMRPDEVTIQMLADASGMSLKAAAYRLNQKVAAGELTRRQTNVNGKCTNVYRKA